MPEKIQDLIDQSKTGSISADAMRTLLHESEGAQGSPHVAAVGHPLQHVRVLLTQGDDGPTSRGTQLKAAYHRRGPLRYNQETDQIQPAKGPQSHSQFDDDAQAGALVAGALNNKPGREALKELLDPDKAVKLITSAGTGAKMFKRWLNVMVKPPEDTRGRNFVLLQDEKVQSLVLELHPSKRHSGCLHVQSAYPSSEPLGFGVARIEVTTFPSKAKKTRDFESRDATL